MTTTLWMILWCLVLAVGVFGMFGLLLLVSSGAVRELKASLEDLKGESPAAPESPVEPSDPTEPAGGD